MIQIAKKKSTSKRSSRKASRRAISWASLKEATIAQLERELEKRREKEAAALERRKAELEAQIAALRNSKPSVRASSVGRSSNGAYTPRKGSHGDLVLQALGEGGDWSLDDLAHYSGAGKPTLSAAVLPKLISEGLIVKASRGRYRKA